MRAIFLALVTLTLLVPGASAGFSVYVEDYVIGNQAIVHFSGIDPDDDIALMIDDEEFTIATDERELAYRTKILSPGVHTWAVAMSNGSASFSKADELWVADSFGGWEKRFSVLERAVQNATQASETTQQNLQDVRGNADASLAALDAILKALKDGVEDLNATSVQNLEAIREAQSMTESKVSGLSASTQKDLDQIQGIQSQTATSAARASTWSIVSGSLAILGALAIIGSAGLLWWNAHKRHKEAMALLLAFAAKQGLTGDSQELQTALQILENS